METVAKGIDILGSHIEITLPQPAAAADAQASQIDGVFDECFTELRRLDDTYSRFKDSSVISQLNRSLGSWQPISDELLFLLTQAQDLHDKTDGHFDITIKRDLERLGYDKNYSFTRADVAAKVSANTPTISPISFTRKLAQKIDALKRPVVIDDAKKRVLLRKEIEIGGFGKGFALDCLRKIIESHGIKHYLINAGGDIYAKSTDGQPPWNILLEHPDDLTKAIGKITLDGEAIAGSASNRRKWKTPQGEEYHHLINAKTRLPQMSVKSIFVLAHSGLEADGYATALFTAGFEKAIELVQSGLLPVKILIISAQNQMYQSPDWDIELFN